MRYILRSKQSLHSLYVCVCVCSIDLSARLSTRKWLHLSAAAVETVESVQIWEILFTQLMANGWDVSLSTKHCWFVVHSNYRNRRQPTRKHSNTSPNDHKILHWVVEVALKKSFFVWVRLVVFVFCQTIRTLLRRRWRFSRKEQEAEQKKRTTDIRFDIRYFIYNSKSVQA